ncbi:MAG: DNA-binding response regulator [Betaproteobacteria bacterium]|nr:DNA-binding response regulator [Betaproteobacteria bacterium]NBU49498.1 DNA-binding response regulator [Betaproteobacteria bacterium]
METLLIEDDDTIARELAWRWQQRRWRLTHAADLSRARELLSTTGRFDLVLLDRGLPDGDGLVLLGELRGRDAHLPVLILTAQDQVSDRVAGLRLGADDYLVKPFAVEELEARAEALLRRRESQKAQRLSLGPLVWVESQRLATLNGAAMELSPREFEVLGLLLQRAPRLTPKGALVDELAQRNRDADDSVVEVYISRLRRKLQGSGVCIRTLRGFGYVLERDAEG